MATIPEALAVALEHHQAGRLQAAEQIYRQILQVDPAQADALHLLGVVARQTGEFQLAVDYIQAAIRLKADQPHFHSNLGNAFRDLGHNAQAIACYRHALQLDPAQAQAYFNLGYVLQSQGQVVEAIDCYRRAVQLKPDHAEAHARLADALHGQRRIAEAVASYRRAVELQPDVGELHNNLGNALEQLGRFPEAAASFQRALQLKPDCAEVHFHLGTALHNQGKLGEALASYEQALRLQPEHVDAHWNRGLVLLLQDDWEHGWPEYEWRWRRQGAARPVLTQPAWDGSALLSKKILLYAEQGLGDTIQFARYARLIWRPGATVILQCDEVLAPLLASCPGVDEIVAEVQGVPVHDVHAPLASLPRLLGTSLATVPGEVPYLWADPARVAGWGRELSGVGKFKIGIAWQGNPDHDRDRYRSVSPVVFTPLARLAGVQFVSLQEAFNGERLAPLPDRWPVVDLGSRLDNFADTAAVLANLDLVVTVDTALAHCAGALGKPTWVALPHVPDWRWLLDREDSPWYPSLRLFRQTRPDDWDGVFERMAAALAKVSRHSDGVADSCSW